MLRAWSAGCAGGEEPYTLALVWQLDVGARFPGLGLEIVATDGDPHALERARRACYRESTLKDVPPAWRTAAFERRGDLYCLHDQFRASVAFGCEDIRRATPPGLFDLILCRNLVYTYFDKTAQTSVTEALQERLVPNGVLLVGTHERIDEPPADLAPCADCRGAYVRR